MSFKRLGALILLVSDMDKSIKFYRDVLELPIKNTSSEWVEFFSSGTVLALHPSKSKSRTKNSGVLVGFMVSDLEPVAKKLKDKKVEFFKEPKEESFGKHAIIADPDGHLISIAEISSKISEGFDLIGLIGAE
ncbi:MAG TPA: VOC family protein [Nitrososphaeraceae archaeon]|jgi:lactoylglutathione lyase|nr:VOC family protein [Nitrososphaeraceae archaeon]